MDKRFGFSVVKVLVIIAVLFILLCVYIFPMFGNVMAANMVAVGNRGRDIYVAIIGVNTEREIVGLPPIWPSDASPYTNHITGRVECFNFTNSTDYFDYIFDRANLGTEQHRPLVAGFDFSKLAGAGVFAHTGSGPLTAENNMWTIAKNVTDEMEDIIPILITRNLDPEFLSAVILDAPATNRIPLGRIWKKPFSNKGAVIIRKGGGMFRVRQKYCTPFVIYNRQSFDANANSKYPLKYLTPTKEVIPVGKQK